MPSKGEAMPHNYYPRVSIILTTYNRPRQLERAVESVKNQMFKDWELIIMDDDSDNQEQKDYINHLNHGSNTKIWVVKNHVEPGTRKNTTRYATLINKAITDCDLNEFVCFLCDDDFYYPERLSVMVDYMDNHPDCMACYGKQNLFQEDDNGGLTDYPTKERTIEAVQWHGSCNIDHTSVMVRRSLIEKVGLWDDNPMNWGQGDAVYWQKINDAGYPFHGIDQALDAHVYHSGSWTANAKWQTL